MVVRARGARIIEVGPRDGLQNEARPVPLPSKVAFIDALSACGFSEIEAGAFVSASAVPQMADSGEVFARIRRAPGVVYSALVPNEKGLERALEARADKVSVFTAASETFNRRNINASVAESLERFKPVFSRAARERLPVRAYVSTAFYCPYEGKMEPAGVVKLARTLLELGASEISLGDTIGRAAPADVRRLLDILLDRVPRKAVALHFHDTYGMAVANALAAWEHYGIDAFDASAGGLGGCPYAPGAGGNVATEDLVFALSASAARTTVDWTKVVAAARALEPDLGRPLASRLSRVPAPSERSARGKRRRT